MLYMKQMNMRVSETLLKDLDFIAKMLGVTRTEWLKVKFAEFIRDQKRQLIEDLEQDFISGRVKEAEFKKKAGYPPTKGMLYHKLQVKDGAEHYIKEVLKREGK